MPPLPSPRSSSENGPRHSARTAARPRVSGALTATTGGFPHVQVLEGETANGRHRRPESLADATVLRPPATAKIAGGRRTGLDLTPRRARLDGKRPVVPAGRRATGSRTTGPVRGRHARTADQLAITVRPLPAVRDAAGAVRGWALADSGRPPVTGKRRAPGTLPIESWLLIGRHRQQALLATLVAVGLMLIVVPLQQGGSSTDINPVNAAGQAVEIPAQAPKKPVREQQPEAAEPTGRAKPAAVQPSQPAAAPTAPARPSASAEVKAPVVLVPEGSGPARSLITTGSRTVALTFDDGPDPVQTPKILDLLAQYRIKATFCLVGSQVQRHPDIVRQIAAAGHTLCNHTWDHSLTIGKAKPARIQADLRRTNEAILAAVPGARIPFFRAPGGNFSDTLVQTAYADGMTSLYWEVDPRDWEHAEKEDDTTHVEKVVKSVQQNVKPGSIVLSHDFNQPDTILAYEQLLPWLAGKFELGIPDVPPAPTAAAPAAGAPESSPAAS